MTGASRHPPQPLRIEDQENQTIAKSCGFRDGDGQVETQSVVDGLENLGYRVDANHWGFHNTIIESIKKGGKELIPDDVTLGYDNPREYLPEKLVKLLDEALPPTFAYMF